MPGVAILELDCRGSMAGKSPSLARLRESTIDAERCENVCTAAGSVKSSADIAGQQFRCHEVVDRRSRRMNPSQSLRRLDLLPAQRPCNRDVSIRDFLHHMIVVGQMYHFELRKIAPQPLREPWRNLPQFEAVLESDEKFHEDSFEFLVSSFKLKTGINSSSLPPSLADREIVEG